MREPKARIRPSDRFSLLALAMPPWLARHIVTIAPGESVGPDANEWGDAIVVVEQGSLVLEGTSGASLPLQRGDVLWLEDLPFRALRNEGLEPAVLSSVRRIPPNRPPSARSGRS